MNSAGVSSHCRDFSDALLLLWSGVSAFVPYSKLCDACIDRMSIVLVKKNKGIIYSASKIN